MSFGDDLIEHHESIVDRWYRAWRSSRHPHPGLSEAALKDELPLQLRTIGEQLRELPTAERPSQMWKITERLDPEARVGQEVPIEEVVQEYRLVVRVVREWIEEEGLAPSVSEYSYFYDAVFELVAESVRRYAGLQADIIARDRADYLAGLSHQMRGPLGTLSMQVDALRRLDDRPRESVLDRLGRNVARLRSLVDRVMRIERFKVEELPVRPRPIRAARLLDEVIQNNENEAMRKGLRFECRANRSLEITADPELVLDALGNLVENAVKYTESGFVRVEVEEEADAVVFRVQDSGPGIPPERRAKLFSPMVSESREGAGIGLVIAARAVKAQGGTIEVETAPGKGSMFWFRIPRYVPPREGEE